MLVSASGMAAQQLHLDTVAENLAGADVAGFKAAVASFADVRSGGAGLGVVPTGTHIVFEQGKLERGDGPFDVAIDGPGFFTIERGGERAYTRNGAFHRTVGGALVNDDGWEVRGVRIPHDASSAGVGSDGRVWCVRADVKSVCGRIALAIFPAPERLRAAGSARYEATPEAGVPHRVVPGREGGPRLAFGMLERSNVSIVAAMMEILAAQRAYEANSKGVQAADEMQRIANNLHRS
jgi:flagellar basal-body rod protein FlgG